MTLSYLRALRLPLLWTTLALAMGCSDRSADQPAEAAGPPAVRGEASWTDGQALRPGSELRLSIEAPGGDGISADLLAETELTVSGDSPITFELPYDPDLVDDAAAYELTARLSDPAGNLVMQSSAPVAVLTRGAPASGVQLALQALDGSAAPRSSITDVQAIDLIEPQQWQCEGLSFGVSGSSEQMILSLPKGRVTLARTRSASGARYEGNGVLFWSKGREAQLEIDGQAYAGCQLQEAETPWTQARDRGVRFRAVGNEPGWHLEITPGRNMEFVWAYGQQRASTPVPEAVQEGDITRYHAITEASDLLVELEAAPCRDSMSGEAFDYQVRLVHNGEPYQGCGRNLGQ